MFRTCVVLLAGCALAVATNLDNCMTSSDSACTSCYVGYFLQDDSCPLVTASNWLGGASKLLLT
jgi:hypothetical protein